ncbi:50S ribosomal protein L6 [Buchnera aphidicola (Kurisakia onigurumii)]|uniref:50S ribosomal protein L6 n=1 Tax=Buchnera aphidicola TaxID=9 RepID=UPI0031B69B62
MSRIAKKPILVPKDINIFLKKNKIIIEGNSKKLFCYIHNSVQITHVDNHLIFLGKKKYSNAWAHAGTLRSLVFSMIIGITHGFTKKLFLTGVGYRVFLKNNIINMSLGFSHTIEYIIPSGIDISVPSQTEIILKSADKRLLGQVAANLRSYRIPEPYKGKGIRYENEVIRIKEAKKK